MSPGPPQGGSGEGTEHCMCAIEKVCRGNDGENGGKIVKTSDFYFDLPEELIAQTPLERRDASRLLTLDKVTGETRHMHFYDLPKLLRAGDCLVLNDSRVLPARLLGHRSTGGACEVLLLIDRGEKVWECLVRPGKKLHTGAKITFGNGELTAEVVGEVEGGNRLVRFDYEGIFLETLEKLGKMPLPPYIKEELEDSERYQTVYSKVLGSAAAPTAGLHFTPELLEKIAAKGVGIGYVTLHVGLGTFRPVKEEEITDHEMHSEYICVSRATLERLIAHGAEAIAVGTTSVRTLESLYYVGARLAANPDATEEQLHINQWEPYDTKPTLTPVEALRNIVDYLDRNGIGALHCSTQIIIAPGYDYKIVKMLVTNFHQPQSTLLLLVSAFVHGDWRRIYDYALGHDFRFLSYGDSSLLIP